MTAIYQTRSFHEPFITTSIDVRFEIRLESGKVLYLLNDERVSREDFMAVHAACDTHEDRLKVIEGRLEKMADYVEHIATYLNPEDPRSAASRMLEKSERMATALDDSEDGVGKSLDRMVVELDSLKFMLDPKDESSSTHAVIDVLRQIREEIAGK